MFKVEFLNGTPKAPKDSLVVVRIAPDAHKMCVVAVATVLMSTKQFRDVAIRMVVECEDGGLGFSGPASAEFTFPDGYTLEITSRDLQHCVACNRDLWVVIDPDRSLATKYLSRAEVEEVCEISEDRGDQA